MHSPWNTYSAAATHTAAETEYEVVRSQDTDFVTQNITKCLPFARSYVW